MLSWEDDNGGSRSLGQEPLLLQKNYSKSGSLKWFVCPQGSLLISQNQSTQIRRVLTHLLVGTVPPAHPSLQHVTANPVSSITSSFANGNPQLVPPAGIWADRSPSWCMIPVMDHGATDSTGTHWGRRQQATKLCSPELTTRAPTFPSRDGGKTLLQLNDYDKQKN